MGFAERLQICKMWGFGRWSADMLAIFYLGRLDVWPSTDGGIKTACKIFFNTNKEEEMKLYIKGHETIAAVYLWETINKKILF